MNGNKMQAVYAHPQFDGYDKDWQEKCTRLSPSEWAEGYDRAFVADMKNRGIKPLGTGHVQLQLTPIQMEVFNRAKRSKTVLDYGCGPGYLTVALLATGVEARGVDCSGEAIKFCKSHSRGGWGAKFDRIPSTHDLTEFGQFDCVVAVEVLEHLPDPEKSALMLWDRVKDGGQLIITVPRDGVIPSPYHIQTFDFQRIRDLAEKLVHVIPGTEFVANIVRYEREFLLQIKKEALVLKYCRVVGTTEQVSAHAEIIEENRFKTGVFNWARTFNGFEARIEELKNPAQYGCIHVQLAGDTFDAPRILRERIGPPGEGKPKLVVNLDYAPEWWHQYPSYPDLMLFQLQQADVVFAQNRATAALLSELLGKSVPLIPHPIDTEAMKSLILPFGQRAATDAAILVHRDNNIEWAKWVMYGTSMELITHVVGYNPTGRPGWVDSPHFSFSHVHPLMSGEAVLQLFRRMWFALETYTHSVQGRATMELAGLGIPTVGMGCVDAQDVCFPDLICGSIVEARSKIRRLLTDYEFYKRQMEAAMERVEMYSMPKMRDRFLRAVSDAR